MPSFSDLFASASGQVRSERRPALCSVLLDKLADSDIVFFRPWTFNDLVLFVVGGRLGSTGLREIRNAHDVKVAICWGTAAALCRVQLKTQLDFEVVLIEVSRSGSKPVESATQLPHATTYDTDR